MDIASFKLLAKNLEVFADKRLAHFEIGSNIYPPSFPEVSNVLSELAKLVKKYYLFIKNIDADLRAFYDKNWMAIFDNWKSTRCGQ